MIHGWEDKTGVGRGNRGGKVMHGREGETDVGW